MNRPNGWNLLASSPAHEILDSLAAKHWAIKLATEAACSVLSVDSIIMSKPLGGQRSAAGGELG